MRTNIYSCNTQIGEYLIELHTSDSKVRRLKKKDLDGKAKELVGNVASMVCQLKNLEGGGNVDKIIISRDWKKAQIINKNGVSENRTIAQIEKAYKKTLQANGNKEAVLGVNSDLDLSKVEKAEEPKETQKLFY